MERGSPFMLAADADQTARLQNMPFQFALPLLHPPAVQHASILCSFCENQRPMRLTHGNLLVGPGLLSSELKVMQRLAK